MPLRRWGTSMARRAVNTCGFKKVDGGQSRHRKSENKLMISMKLFIGFESRSSGAKRRVTWIRFGWNCIMVGQVIRPRYGKSTNLYLC